MECLRISIETKTPLPMKANSKTSRKTKKKLDMYKEMENFIQTLTDRMMIWILDTDDGPGICKSFFVSIIQPW
jgi:hypothetical protein